MLGLSVMLQGGVPAVPVQAAELTTDMTAAAKDAAEKEETDKEDVIPVSEEEVASWREAMGIKEPAGAQLSDGALQAGDDSLQERINAAKAGEIIVLDEDVSLTDTITIPQEKSIMLQMNGHKIKQTGNVRTFNLKSGSKLFLVNGTLEGPGSGNVINDNGGAIYADSRCTVDLQDVTVENFMTSKSGGAIYAAGRVTVNLKGKSVLKDNTAKWGGALYLNGELNNISLSNEAEIRNNKADNDGGGIYFYPTFLSQSAKDNLYGGGSTKITGNVAGKNGGGIYFNATNISIKGVRIEKNTAASNGGGIFFQYGSSSIDSSGIDQNQAQKGGGIYVNAKNVSLSSVSMEGNIARADADTGAGGALFAAGGKNPSLSGKMIIRSNKRTGANGPSDNLVLDGSDTYLSLSGPLAAKSEVYLRKTDPGTGQLTAEPGNYDARQFKADADGYYIQYTDDRLLNYVKGDPSGSLYAKETKISLDEWKTKTEKAEGLTYEAGGKSYDVYYGYGSAPSNSDYDEDLVLKYYFSDGYFFSDPYTYDPHIASFCQTLAMAAGESNLKGMKDYRYKFDNVKSMLRGIGCADENIYINDWYTKKPTADSIGVAIGMKEAEEMRLVTVAIRGAGYESEWAGNVTLDSDNTKGEDNPEHSGFRSAADQTMADIAYFIGNYGLEDAIKEGRVRFLVTGYSRASATANLTAKRLIDKYGDFSAQAEEDPSKANKVTGYCFEVPAGGTDEGDRQLELSDDKAGSTGYASIHNLVNPSDLVPKVGPDQMGFKRYGTDHFLIGTEAGSVRREKKTDKTDQNKNVPVTCMYDNTSWEVGSAEYEAQKKVMMPHLLAVNDDLTFFDRFKEYYLTIGLENFATHFEAYTFNEAQTAMTLNPWLDQFFNSLQRWKLLSADKSLNRENYSSYRMAEGTGGWAADAIAPQEAFRSLVKLLMSIEPEKKDILMLALSGITNKFDTPLVGSGTSLLTLYNDLIGNSKGGWDQGSEMQDKWLNDIWGKLTDNSYGQTGIQDALSVQELKDFKKAFPVLMGMFMRLAYIDNNYSGTTESGHDAAQMWLVGTLAKNMTIIGQAHYQEVTLAWLRSYDSYYSDEINKKYTYTGKISDVTKPEFAEKESTKKGYDSVYVSNAADTGDVIYYSVTENGKKSAEKLYQPGTGILLPKKSSDTVYTVSAYAIKDMCDGSTRTWKESAAATQDFTVKKYGNEKPAPVTVIDVISPEIYLSVYDDEGKMISDRSYDNFIRKELPDMVQAMTSANGILDLPVEWQEPDGYSPNLEYQLLDITGTVTYPENCVDEEGNKLTEREVTAFVDIDGAWQTNCPRALPAGGKYTGSVTVSLECSEEAGAKIYYTLDGSEPFKEDGTIGDTAILYDASKPVNILYTEDSPEVKLKAAAAAEDMIPSETITEIYELENKPEAVPDKEELDRIDRLYLIDGQKLSDLTDKLPSGYKWAEAEGFDIDKVYRLSELEDPEYPFADAALVYNPDPAKYRDVTVAVSLPVLGQFRKVESASGNGIFDGDGIAIKESPEGGTVFLTAEEKEGCKFVCWMLETVNGGTPPEIRTLDDEELEAYKDVKAFFKEDGTPVTGLQYFIMPGDDVKATAVYSGENDGVALENIDTQISLKAGEQRSVWAEFMPKTSAKQVQSVSYKVISKYKSADELHEPLKYLIDRKEFASLKANMNKKLPAVAAVNAKGRITAKWDKKLKADEGITILRITMKLKKEKGEKTAKTFIADYPVIVTPTDYEKGLKKQSDDKTWSMKTPGSASLDLSKEKEKTVTVTFTGRNISETLKDLEINASSLNEEIADVETAVISTANGNKAEWKLKVSSAGAAAGTTYISVEGKNKAGRVNRRLIKVTVKESVPDIEISGDSEGLLKGDTIELKQGTYDRLYVIRRGQSAELGKLSWSVKGKGVTVQNGVIYAKAVTAAPATVTVKCGKIRKTVTVKVLP